jgi:CSLREA domain-containing protein
VGPGGAAPRRLTLLAGLLAMLGALALALGLPAARADIYWSNFQDQFSEGTDSFIGHAHIDGSEANAEFLNVGLTHPARMAANNEFIYASFEVSGGGGGIGRARLDGSEHRPFFITAGTESAPVALPNGVRGLAVTNEFIYWTSSTTENNGEGSSAIGRAHLDGTHVEPNFIPLDSEHDAVDLTILGNHIYYGEADAIGRVNINGTENEPEYITGEPEAKPPLTIGLGFGIAANAQFVYFNVGGGIGRAENVPGGGTIETKFIPEVGLSPVDGIAIDSQHIYWGNEEDETVGRAALNGSAVEAGWIQNAGNPEGFAIDHRIVVNSTEDLKDATPGDGFCAAAPPHGGACTLRAAIEEANAEKQPQSVSITFAITGVAHGTIATIKPASPLPEITTPVDLDASTQPEAFSVADGFTAKAHKIGAILDGSSLAEGSNGLKLGTGATGSTIAGLQIQNVKGDGVLLEAERSQLADSILYLDQVGAEVAANGDAVGFGNELEGNIFFRDGQLEELPEKLSKLSPKEGLAAVEPALRAAGAGVLLTKSSKNTRILGDWIGIHGEGFSEGADKLPDDGIKSLDIAHSPVMPVGIAVMPGSGSIENVTIGGTERGERDVISGTLFGVFSGAPSGSFISGLKILGDTFGANVEANGATGLIGGVVGVLASGQIGGLQIGGTSAGSSFGGEVIGAFIGEELANPIVQDNTFGRGESVGNTEKGLGLLNGFGLLAANTQGAAIGGSGTAQGNTFHGNLIALGMVGEKLKADDVVGNTIGEAPATNFTTFLKEPSEFNNVLGLVAIGNAVAGKSSPSQELLFQGNTLQGDTLGSLSIDTTGASFLSNTIQNDALGLVDVGSGGMKIGETSHGNSFLDVGLGLLQANFEPNAAELKQAQVNPEDDSAKTRQASLSGPDENYAFDGIDAITTAELSPTSIEPPSTPGQHNSIIANRFGIDGEGHAQPDELPVVIGGDEHEERIGGKSSGEGNVIEDNRDAGLWLASFGTEHSPTAQILGNTIYNNENFTGSLVGFPGLGIDLIGETPELGYGVNQQDPTQPDPTGPDNLQNAPILSSASSEGGTLTLTGSLHGAPSTDYLVEVYADENKNPFGAGEGQTLLGRLSLSTDASGNVAFTSTFTDPGLFYRYISSTATTVPASGAGVTSEFSVDAAISRPAVPTSPVPPIAPAPVVPAPAPKGAAATTVASSGSAATTGSAVVTLPAKASCSSATASPCTVTTTVTVPGGSAGKAGVSEVVVAKAPKPVTIGHGSMKLARGATAPLRITLSRQGLALLRKRHLLAIAVTVKITGAGRPTVTRTLHFHLKYKKPAKRR